ncbi:MAG: hypothetical protein ACOYEV_03580 [Candidatus Nanopelagicales bacterium]
MNRSAIREITEAWDNTPVTASALAGLLGLSLLMQFAYGVGPVLVRLAVGLAGWTTTSVILAGLWIVVLRRPGRGRRRHTVVVLGYTLAGWASGVAAARVCAALEVPATPVAAYLAAGVIWMTSLAILTNQRRTAARAMAALESQRHELEQQRATATAALADTYDDLAAVVSQVERAVGSVRGRLSRLSEPAEFREVAAGLLTTVQFLVRPTSHSLAREAASASAPAPPAPGAADPAGDLVALRSPRATLELLRVDWALLRDGLGRFNPFRPLAVAVNLLPLEIAGAVVSLRGGSPGRPGSLAGLLAVYAILLAGSIHWNRLRRTAATGGVAPPMTPSEPALASPTGQPAGPAVPPGSTDHASEIVRRRVAFAMYAAMVGGYILVAWAVAGRFPAGHLAGALMPAALALMAAASAALGHYRQESLAEVARLVERSRWATAATQQHLWASRRQLALAMHGRLQAGLTAIAMVLRVWVDAGPEREPVAELRARVDCALEGCLQAVADPTTPEVSTLLTELTAVWSGVLEIEVHLEPTARQRLDADPAASAAAGEILRELLLNSVRHGGAHRAVANLALWADNVLQLEVQAFEPPDSSAPRPSDPGLGTDLVSSLSLGSDVTQGEGWRCTRVLLPIRSLSAVAE